MVLTQLLNFFHYESDIFSLTQENEYVNIVNVFYTNIYKINYLICIEIFFLNTYLKRYQ